MRVRHSEETKREARRLYATGHSGTDIGRLLGVPCNTVWSWQNGRTKTKPLHIKNCSEEQKARQDSWLSGVKGTKLVLAMMQETRILDRSIKRHGRTAQVRL